jgi:pyruvate/2-oxoglutarate dehydrogenase complex dihydrolipoamide dehydrogenase (E3) component
MAPAVAMVGSTEEQLMQEGIPHQAAKVRLRAASGSRNPAGQVGLVKLLFHQGTRRLLGVHAIGETAVEVVRIGQAIMAADGTLGEFCRKAVLSPTMAGCCKGATIEGHARRRVDQPVDLCGGIEPHIGGGLLDEPAPELAELVAM